MSIHYVRMRIIADRAPVMGLPELKTELETDMNKLELLQALQNQPRHQVRCQAVIMSYIYCYVI